MVTKGKGAIQCILTIIFAVLLAVALSACSREETLITVPNGAQIGEMVGLEPCLYETGDVEYAAECGTLVVPENRSNPEARLIALPVMRIQATAVDPAEPVFWLAGGPGQSNMRFSHQQDLTALLKNHDFVLVGYRGVDGSVVLDCPEISQALKNPPGDLLSDAALASYGTAAAQCGTRLQSEGIDLEGYSMSETIDDMEDARRALGYERINLLGASYGTRLAMIYEWLYPDSLQRVGMIEVNTPGHFVWETEMIESQLADYGQLCAEDAYCHARTSDLIETMRGLANDMPDQWLFIPIDEDKVKLISFIMFGESIQTPGNPFPLYGAAAIDMWLDAADGDASGMVLAMALHDLFIPEMSTWGHFLAMGSTTGEYSDPARDYPAELNPSESILGSPVSLLVWGMGTGWPIMPATGTFTELQFSNVETLLEAGSLDFMTPPVGAEELLPYLSRGELVMLREFGHGNTFWNSQPEARLRMLTTFFDTGQADASLYTYQPLDFDVGLGWSGLARRIVAGLLLFITVVGALILFFVRRRRRRITNRLPGRRLKPLLES